MQSKPCTVCKHLVSQHSEAVGCLECRCKYVVRDGITVNPDGKYTKPLEVKDTDRPGFGKLPCSYCAEKDCNYSCDESQAGGFTEGTELIKGGK